MEKARATVEEKASTKERRASLDGDGDLSKARARALATAPRGSQKEKDTLRYSISSSIAPFGPFRALRYLEIP